MASSSNSPSHFVSFGLPDATKDSLCDTIQQLAPNVGQNMRYTSRKNLHLTLGVFRAPDEVVENYTTHSDCSLLEDNVNEVLNDVIADDGEVSVNFNNVQTLNNSNFIVFGVDNNSQMNKLHNRIKDRFTEMEFTDCNYSIIPSPRNALFS